MVCDNDCKYHLFHCKLTKSEERKIEEIEKEEIEKEEEENKYMIC